MRRVMLFLGGMMLGLGFGILIFFGILRKENEPNVSMLIQGSTGVPIPSLNAPAPNFELKDLSGEPVILEKYRGKPVMLNFWATWCAPCRLEMPVFQNRFEKYSGELSIIAVNNAENPEDVQAFVDEFGLTFDFLLDPEAEIQRLYRVSGYPTTFLIDVDGVIRVRHIGILSEDQLDRYLQDIGIQ